MHSRSRLCSSLEWTSWMTWNLRLCRYRTSLHSNGYFIYLSLNLVSRQIDALSSSRTGYIFNKLVKESS